MGASNSKNTVDLLTDICVNVTQSAVQSCTTTVDASQIIDLQAAGNIVYEGDISQKQSVSVDIACAMSSEKQNEIRSLVANELALQAEALTKGALTSLGGTTAEAATNIENLLEANVTQTDEQNLNSILNQTQTIQLNAGGSIIFKGNMSQEQSTKLVASAMMQSGSYSKVIQKVANDIDSVTKSSAEGSDSIFADLVAKVAKTFGLTASAALLAVPMMIGGVIFLIILLIALPFMLGGSKKKEKPSDRTAQSSMGTNIIMAPPMYGQQPMMPAPVDPFEKFRYGGEDETEDSSEGLSGNKKETKDKKKSKKEKVEDEDNTNDNGEKEDNTDDDDAEGGVEHCSGGCEACGCGCPEVEGTKKCGPDCACGCWKK